LCNSKYKEPNDYEISSNDSLAGFKVQAFGSKTDMIVLSLEKLYTETNKFLGSEPRGAKFGNSQ